MTDQQIVAHLQQKKYSLAVKGLYNILPHAKKYITANNGTANDAQDIFQDALVILYRKVQTENFTLTAPLKNYLLAIVKNCWLQELRQRKKIPLGETSIDIAAPESDEEADFRTAKNAFDMLGEKCRQLLILFYFKQLSFKSIADLLSFSDEKTAKNQKYRCLQKAKEHYLTLTKNATHG
jgi:RNA polymerase sigma factor (sigma-70 family)